jgi:DNA-binding transcriptional regulator YiaG
VRTGQLLSYSSFASDLGVSPNTVRSWLSVLQASNVRAPDLRLGRFAAAPSANPI